MGSSVKEELWEVKWEIHHRDTVYGASRLDVERWAASRGFPFEFVINKLHPERAPLTETLYPR